MNKQEFEDRIKSTVSDSLFEEWNRVYMAAGQDVDKDIFCNAVKATKGNSNLFTLLMSLRNKVEIMQIKVDNYNHDVEMARTQLRDRNIENDTLRDEKQVLMKQQEKMEAQNTSLAMALIRAGLDADAIAIIGHGRVIATKITLDIELNTADRQYLIETLNK